MVIPSEEDDHHFALPDLPEGEEEQQVTLVDIPRGRLLLATANGGSNNNGTTTDAPSVATTELASRIGSIVGEPKDAFLRSITFQSHNRRNNNNDDGVVQEATTLSSSETMGWGIHVRDPLSLENTTPINNNNRGLSFRRKRKKKRLYVDSVEGCVCLSTIQPGDYLYSINGKRIGPSYNAERAMQRMKDCYEEEGVLSVAVGNEEGDDVLIQATILKPKPTMTYEELGIVVWFWGCLVIKSIHKESLFYHSVLKSEDHIVSVNDILCTTTEQFAQLVTELDKEIVVVVKRGRQRWTGKFG